MYTETEGIILRQTKTVNNRRMVLLFSKRFGKISAGTSVNEKGKAALAMKPFTHGKYTIFKKGEYFNIYSADVVKSYYKIGEDVDKFLYASFALELLSKITEEGKPVPKIFNLCLDFLSAIEKREKKYETITLAYEMKLLTLSGYAPNLDSCIHCNAKDDFQLIDIKEGGLICKKCTKIKGIQKDDRLIYSIDFDTIQVLKYFSKNSLESLENIAVSEDILREIQEIMRQYLRYYFDIGELKTEKCMGIY